MTKEEILSGESDVLEFKRDVPEQSVKYIKTVVAFANGKGGSLVFGVDDKTHKVVGIKKSEVFQDAGGGELKFFRRPILLPIQFSIVANPKLGRASIFRKLTSGASSW